MIASWGGKLVAFANEAFASEAFASKAFASTPLQMKSPRRPLVVAGHCRRLLLRRS